MITFVIVEASRADCSAKIEMTCSYRAPPTLKGIDNGGSVCKVSVGSLILIEKMKIKTDIILADCAEVLCDLPENTVDLVFTSPPYADQRKKTYGGIHPDKYVDWFLPISKELLRILKPTGTLWS